MLPFLLSFAEPGLLGEMRDAPMATFNAGELVAVVVVVMANSGTRLSRDRELAPPSVSAFNIYIKMRFKRDAAGDGLFSRCRLPRGFIRPLILANRPRRSLAIGCPCPAGLPVATTRLSAQGNTGAFSFAAADARPPRA